MKLTNLFILLFFIAINVSAQKTLDDLLQQYNTHSISYTSVEELKMLQTNEEILILDAREKQEYDVSHIPGSKYVGFNNFDIEKISKEIINKNTQIVIYCSLGIRSEKIGEKLEKEGYTNVKNLYGGIFEWKNKGYIVVDNTGKETEDIHTFSPAWSKWLTNGNKVN